jgi:hypothetical protein
MAAKPAPKISELDKNIKFSITNSLAMIGQGSFTADKTKGDGISSHLQYQLQPG